MKKMAMVLLVLLSVLALASVSNAELGGIVQPSMQTR
jgi:hypothetical protein